MTSKAEENRRTIEIIEIIAPTIKLPNGSYHQMTISSPKAQKTYLLLSRSLGDDIKYNWGRMCLID